MIPALAVALVGLVFDPRVITGAPGWMKPAKFAVSIGIYSLTLAWVFTYLPVWPRLRTIVGWTTALTFIVEIAIIDLQAMRGTSSHFNVATPVDGTLFSIMGMAILVQTLASLAVAIALFRQRFADRALGWALRFGLAISIGAASMGGLMVRPTAAQIDEARAAGRMTRAGAHTVGAVDGGPGLPVTNWSLEHGDLRVPHFLGLHAIQILPLAALGLSWLGWGSATRARTTIVLAVSYASLVSILLWQALRGQPVIAPDAATLVTLVVWAVATTVALRIASAVSTSMPVGDENA
jgi:hypothetical protein